MKYAFSHIRASVLSASFRAVLSFISLAVFQSPAQANLDSILQVTMDTQGLARTTHCRKFTRSSDVLSCVGDFSLNGSQIFYTAAAQAEDLGVLNGRSFLYLSRPSGAVVPPAPQPQQRLSIEFVSGFTDTFTIHGGTAGTTGTLQVAFNVTGSKYQSPEGLTTSSWAMSVRNPITGIQDSKSDSLPASVIVSTSILFGEPVELRFFLNGIVSLDAVQYGGYDTQQADLSLGHTARIQQFQVTDSTGLPITASIVAQSGGNYFGLLPIPEPSTQLLLTVGLGIIVLRRLLV